MGTMMVVLSFLDGGPSIAQTGLHVIQCEARVISKQLIKVRVARKIRQHQIDWDPRAFDHGLPDENPRVSHDPVLLGECLHHYNEVIIL